MYSPEDDIGLGIFAGALPPPFDDPCVVAIALEVGIWAVQCDKGPYEEFKGDCLCPSNVAALGVPVTGERPCTPIFSHNDSKAHSGACI
jgi:hypothetical protein